jgi:homoserine O-acetyltransferase
MKKEGSQTDANDVIWRNEATISYDVTSRLPNIKAKTLIIGVNQDLYFPPQTDTIPMSILIDGSTLFLYDSTLGHLGSSEIKKAEKVIEEFLGDIEDN